MKKKKGWQPTTSQENDGYKLRRRRKTSKGWEILMTLKAT